MQTLTKPSEIKAIIQRHGFRFSKALGQNFIINPSVCPEMAEMAGADENIGALEIGPGIGVLTAELAKRCRKVVSVEIDNRLMPILAETLSDYNNIEIINADIMTTDINKLIEEHFDGMEVIVCANLPYYITSPVIMKLLEDKINAKSITVMVQKEAAQRLCASVPSRNVGAVTIAVNYYAKPELLFDVPRGSFMPPPEVDSAVIKLDIHKNPPVDISDEAAFFKIIKAAFSQRRKTLLNSLSAGLAEDKAKMSEILMNAGVEQSSRAENLTLENFAAIQKFYSEAITNL